VITLLKILPAKWEQAKGYLRLDLEAIEAALNARWAAVFGPDNQLQPGAIAGDATPATRYVSNTGPDNLPTWAQVDLTNGVTGVLPLANGGTNNTAFAAGAIPFSDGSQLDESAALAWNAATNILQLGGAIRLAEISTPATPAADTGLLYTIDQNGNTRPAFEAPDGSSLIITRDNLIVARNTTGGVINPGQAVYISGSTGNVPNVELARADSPSTMPAIGLVYETIANNGFGRIM
jgi:hypothetical protein